MILFISDFNLKGSGYMNIATRLCKELVLQHNFGVTALGLGYKGEQHDWPYTITPVASMQELTIIVTSILRTGVPVEAIIVALDVPLQVKLSEFIKKIGFPHIAIFPLESPPLCSSWAMALLGIDKCFVMSKFAQKELKRQFVDSEFLPIPVNPIWKPIEKEEFLKVRKALGYDADSLVITTIADNQERKNLSATAAIISGLVNDSLKFDKMGYAINGEQNKIVWNLVTRINSPVGWDLNDLLARYGIAQVTRLYDRGLSEVELHRLLATSDAFLLTSKAEGLALPLLEAMACEIPVFATNCTAMKEHIGVDERGTVLPHDYILVDPFGNGHRYLVDVATSVKILKEQLKPLEQADKRKLNLASAYVGSKNWKLAGNLLAESIKEIIAKRINAKS